MLGGRTVLVDMIMVLCPLELNMILRRDYVYAMNVVVSMFFHVMHFPHNGRIVIIDKFSSDNHHPNLTLVQATSLYVLSFRVEFTPPRLNYVASYSWCSISYENEPLQSCYHS
jgi:hypothetical protein